MGDFDLNFLFVLIIFSTVSCGFLLRRRGGGVRVGEGSENAEQVGAVMAAPRIRRGGHSVARFLLRRRISQWGKTKREFPYSKVLTII